MAGLIIAVLLAWPHEHQVASSIWLENFPKPYKTPVNVRISDLAKRTVAIGEKIIAANGGRIAGEKISIPVQQPTTQPAELFKLADLMQYWTAGIVARGVAAEVTRRKRFLRQNPPPHVVGYDS